MPRMACLDKAVPVLCLLLAPRSHTLQGKSAREIKLGFFALAIAKLFVAEMHHTPD